MRKYAITALLQFVAIIASSAAIAITWCAYAFEQMHLAYSIVLTIINLILLALYLLDYVLLVQYYEEHKRSNDKCDD